MASQNLFVLSGRRLESAIARTQASLRCGPAQYWTLVLCAVVQIALGTALLYGHSLAGQGDMVGLARCAGQLCFQGMIPGQTSWATLKPAYAYERIVKSYSSDGEVVLFLSLDGKSLGLVIINPAPDRPITAGEIIALMGIPSCVEVHRSPSELVLHYPALDASFPTCSDFNLETRAASITLRAAITPSERSSDLCSLNAEDYSRLANGTTLRPWHGFASMERYAAGW